jgi:hypothetical protein
MRDFVTTLREQLVDAAERESARRLPRVHAPAPRLVLAAAATAAMALIVLLAAGALNPRPVDEDRQVAEPTPDARDLFGGTLEPGVRYRTTEFAPQLSFVVDDDRWMATDTTLSHELRLIRVNRGAPESDPPRIQLLAFLRVDEVADPTVRGLAASLTAAPDDLYEWLRAHPDLRVGPARAVTVAGVPGRRFAVRTAFDRPVHVDPWCRQNELFTCTYLAPGMNFPDGSRALITVLDTAPEPLTIVMAGMSQSDVTAVREAATPLLESLSVTRR